MSVPRPDLEIEELLGAYALDAVDPDERDRVEAHLAGCPRCRDELAGHLEVAAMLGSTGAAAPDGVWGRIVASLEEPPPALRLEIAPVAPVPPVALVGEGPEPSGTAAAVVALDRGTRPSGRRIRRGLVAMVAAAAVVILALGAEVVRQDRRLDDMHRELAAQGMEDDMLKAMASPDAHQMALSSPSGEPMAATAVMTPTGTGYFMATDLPALAEDRTYQLWGVMGGGQVVSLGVLGSTPHLAAFEAQGGLEGLAVTAEVKGGVASSSNAPVLTS